MIFAVLVITGLLTNNRASAVEIPVVEWTRQLGTSFVEIGHDVSVDSSGNVYVTGYTGGGLDGNSDAGGADMFLLKYDTAGAKLWSRQLGTSDSDYGRGVSVDDGGNIYVTGFTKGVFDGATNAYGYDMFLTKYDAAGARLWICQLGTSGWDEGFDVSVDGGGNAYVTGYTYGSLDGNTYGGGDDMFLTKYDTEGAKLWTRQLGTSNSERGSGVSVDAGGNAYVTGYTEGGLDGNSNAGEEDMFLTKYDTDGTKLWTQQLGSSGRDYGCDVAVDGDGNAYVTGTTYGDLDGHTNVGGYDMFLTKYDTAGAKLWTRQLGTHKNDSGNGVSVDGSGNVYVTGNTDAGLDGNASAGELDVFLAKYDADGAKLWTHQLGTSQDDIGYRVSVDGNGNAYITGFTAAGLDGNTNAGSYDMFLIKVVPEPSTIVLLCMGAFGLLAHGWRRRA